MLRIDREATASLLSQIGYDIDRNFKFKARGEERTASAIINRDGSIHDFGGGGFTHGDILDFLIAYHSMNFKDAKALVEGTLGTIPTLEKPKTNWKDDKINTPFPAGYIQKNILEAKKHKHEFFAELKELFQGKVNDVDVPCCTFTQAVNMAKRYNIGYIPDTNRLIMPIKNEKGQAMTFWKYRRHYDPHLDSAIKPEKFTKVFFTKNRVRPPFALYGFRSYLAHGRPIILTEGEKDTLTCLANGLPAACIGSAKCIIPDGFISYFKGASVIIAGDYDDAGELYNHRLSQQLNGIASKIKVLDWELKAKKDGIKLFPKFDLSDYFAFKNYKDMQRGA